MATKKYVTLSKISIFLDRLKGLFATKEEVNKKISDVYDDAQAYADTAVSYKTQVQIITWEADD